MSSTDNCYVLKIGSGSYDSEISWSIADAGGSTQLTGGAPSTSSVCDMIPTSQPTTTPASAGEAANVGAIIGIVVGCIILVAVIVAFLCCCKKPPQASAPQVELSSAAVQYHVITPSATPISAVPSVVPPTTGPERFTVKFFGEKLGLDVKQDGPHDPLTVDSVNPDGEAAGRVAPGSIVVAVENIPVSDGAGFAAALQGRGRPLTMTFETRTKAKQEEPASLISVVSGYFTFTNPTAPNPTEPTASGAVVQGSMTLRVTVPPAVATTPWAMVSYYLDLENLGSAQI